MFLGGLRPENTMMPSTLTCLLKASQSVGASKYPIFLYKKINYPLSWFCFFSFFLLLSDLSNPHLNNTVPCSPGRRPFPLWNPLASIKLFTNTHTHTHIGINVSCPCDKLFSYVHVSLDVAWQCGPIVVNLSRSRWLSDHSGGEQPQRPEGNRSNSRRSLATRRHRITSDESPCFCL